MLEVGCLVRIMSSAVAGNQMKNRCSVRTKIYKLGYFELPWGNQKNSNGFLRERIIKSNGFLRLRSAHPNPWYVSCGIVNLVRSTRLARVGCRLTLCTAFNTFPSHPGLEFAPPPP